jgi:hypothetical protein
MFVLDVFAEGLGLNTVNWPGPAFPHPKSRRFA